MTKKLAYIKVYASFLFITSFYLGTIIFWWANKKIWRTQLKNCIIILDKNTIKGGSPYE